MLVAAGALDPDARVWLLDGKLVELAVWAPVAERLVGPDGEEAIAMLRELRARWRPATASCSPAGCARSAASDGLPLHLVVVRRAGVLPHAAGPKASGRSSPSCCATSSRAAARPA